MLTYIASSGQFYSIEMLIQVITGETSKVCYHGTPHRRTLHYMHYNIKLWQICFLNFCHLFLLIPLAINFLFLLTKKYSKHIDLDLKGEVKTQSCHD